MTACNSRSGFSRAVGRQSVHWTRERLNPGSGSGSDFKEGHCYRREGLPALSVSVRADSQEKSGARWKL
jgi:hypothetical protein